MMKMEDCGEYLKIIRGERNILFDIYRKPTHTQRTNRESSKYHHPQTNDTFPFNDPQIVLSASQGRTVQKEEGIYHRQQG